MLTRMGKQEEQESTIVCDAAEIPNEVIHDYELIYEQLKIAKEDITKTDRLLAIPLQGSQQEKRWNGSWAFNCKGYPKSIQGKYISG